jgi:hypothetical protein
MRLLPLAFLLLAGCATTAPTPRPVSAVTDADRKRLREWRTAFTAGLAQARAAGLAESIAREGPLLQPDTALGGGIPGGRYRCRILKLGARQSGMPALIAYPSFTCRVGVPGPRGVQSFAKLSGSQRQVGTIRPHDQLRSLFTGTLVFGDEQRALRYGLDPDRDLAGWVERVGEQRWRLLLPYPHFESLIGVVELVPAP